MKKEIDTSLSEDYNNDNELDVEWYPVPDGLKDAWDEVVEENSNKKIEQNSEK